MLQPLLRPVAVAANDRFYGASPISLPRPPILDLDFVDRPSLQYPGLPPISFSRASTATYRDASGVRRVAAVNEPRFDHDKNGNPLGLLVERDNTNYLRNSLTPVSQTTQTLNVGVYTLSCEGAGAVSLISNSAVVTGAGTATEGNPIVFQVTTAGTVDVTVTDPLETFQIENFNGASSVIVTGGTAVSRAADVATLSMQMNSLRGTLIGEAHLPQAVTVGAQVFCALDDGTNVNRVVIFRGAGLTVNGGCRAVVSTSSTNRYQADSSFAISAGSFAKIAIGYESGNTASAVNGVLSIETLDNAFVLTGINVLRMGSQTPAGSASLYGHLRRVRYWPEKLPDHMLVMLTH